MKIAGPRVRILDLARREGKALLNGVPEFPHDTLVYVPGFGETRPTNGSRDDA